MSELVHSTTTQACGAGFPDCACDLMSNDTCDFLGYPRGTVLPFCECHDCYICGEIDCDGH